MSDINPRELEIEWYKENGKYSDRIAKDNNGNSYVIGDLSWNTAANIARIEYIEVNMDFALTNNRR